MFGKSKRLENLELEIDHLTHAIKEMSDRIIRQDGRVTRNAIDIVELKEDIYKKLIPLEDVQQRLKNALDVKQDQYREDEESQD